MVAAIIFPAAAWSAHEFPRPKSLMAEPTPNDDGTRITLRWPATSGELRQAKTEERLSRLPDAEIERKDFGYEYVLYISRDPDWRWFECKRVYPAAGFVKDTGIAGHYPYHFSRGKEHYAILAPTSAMKVRVNGELVDYTEVMPWLAREQRYADWLDGALGKLNNCQKLLVRIDRAVREQKGLLDRYEEAEPRWRNNLPAAKEGYVKQFGAPESGVDFDALQLVKHLTERKQSLSEKAELSEKETKELETVEEKLDVLEPAQRLSAARQRKEAMKSQLGSYRQAFFSAAGYYAYYSALIGGECRQALAEYAGTGPDDMDQTAISRVLGELDQELDRARQEVRNGSPAPEHYGRFDRLAYLTFLADYCLKREASRPDWRNIRDEMLSGLSEALEGASLPERRDRGILETFGEPDTDLLLERLDDLGQARERLERQKGKEAADEWISADQWFDHASKQWRSASKAELRRQYEAGSFREPENNPLKKELVRLGTAITAVRDRLEEVKRRHARRRYHFRLAAAATGGLPADETGPVAAAAARANLFDTSNLTNIVFAAIFAVAVVGMLLYVRRNPDVFIRKIPGLDAVDEAIGRATEMGKPVLFVHGLSEISTIAVIASLNVLGKIARQVAVYDTELLVANERPIVYSVSYEVVQEGYMEAGRPDAFNPDNVMMVATEQFPYVAAVAGIMNRRKPAANLFMGKFYAESLILAEAGALTGAIQIAATDAFTQLPFFITTCDYTLMGEELYAASAYLSRDPKLLSTIKAQDVGKSILLGVVPVGTVLASAGIDVVKVIFTAYAKT